MDDGVDRVLLAHSTNERGVCDVPVYERVPRGVDRAEHVVRVRRVSEGVEVYDLAGKIRKPEQVANEGRTDEAATTGDQDVEGVSDG